MSDHYESDKRIFDPEDIIGKTIEAVFAFDGDSEFLIEFTDKSFIYGESDGYNDGSSTIHYNNSMSFISAVGYGLISNDEYIEFTKKVKTEKDALREDEERKLYESLKKKFEPENKTA